MILAAILLFVAAAAAQDCDFGCPPLIDPVCGTDGVTYDNACLLAYESCRSGTNIDIAHVGECRASSDCSIACTLNYLPVCGTDGETYGNQCELESVACLKKSELAVAYSGECVAQTSECNVACHLNYLPVCGTDGQTYGNQCELETFACLRKSNVAVAYSGECVAETSECNVACTLNYLPVCGTDGQTYGNQCELESVACLRKSNVAVAYSGECVAAECNVACHLNYVPVCGTDGETYGNQCELESLACLRRSNVAVAYSGECVAERSECNVACTLNYLPVCGTDGQTYGNQCELESVACLRKSDLAAAYSGECVAERSECNVACQVNYLPVCGTDGQTYGNQCELESLACLRKSDVAVAYSGECAAETSECNVACTLNYLPVCGTDGQTYGNQCELESVACLRKSNVAVAYSGECVAAECNVACHLNYVPVCGTDGETYGNQCELESLACLRRSNVAVAYSGECVAERSECNVACTLNYLPVCGTDGQTYGNQCELESVACLQKSNLAVAYNGACEEPAVDEPACNIACQASYMPVCGTDGQTYGNDCELESKACVQKSGLAIAYQGSCGASFVPEEVTCNEACLRNWDPVCGSDGITYGNLCQMESFACQKRLKLAVDHAGEC